MTTTNDNCHVLRLKPGNFDPFSCVYSFLQAEVDIRNMFWYPNINRGDIVVDVGAGVAAYLATK